MGWWNGSDGTRLLIAPDSNATESSGRLLSLLHPKSGNTTCYLFNNGVLQEINWFKQTYRSWFLGDYVCEDGRIFTATPVDPVFLMLPLFQEARMKKGDDPGKFRLLEEIIFVNGYPGYQYLLPVAENCMHVVCETKEIGSSIFFRLDNSKVLSWLSYKVHKLKETLPLLDKNYAARDEKDTLADAISILGEYVKDEPWLKLLCNNLNLNFPVESIKSQEIEILQSSMETDLKSSNLLQVKNKSEKKSKTAKQAKKAKVETESRNIKDMFSRASRKGI